MKRIEVLTLVRRACIICVMFVSAGIALRIACAQELTGEIDGRVRPIPHREYLRRRSRRTRSVSDWHGGWSWTTGLRLEPQSECPPYT